jgi:hypothetical protein
LAAGDFSTACSPAVEKDALPPAATLSALAPALRLEPTDRPSSALSLLSISKGGMGLSTASMVSAAMPGRARYSQARCCSSRWQEVENLRNTSVICSEVCSGYRFSSFM